MTTITIFNCGTAYDRSKEEELVADLFRQCEAPEIDLTDQAWGHMPGRGYSHYKIITDGPGSSARPGGYDRARGKALGYGWEANTKKVTEFLTGGLLEKDSVVNFIGWSRGAITCHMMANALAAANWGRSYNIFAIDPVAGGRKASHGESRMSVPYKTRTYWGIYQRDAKSKATGYLGGFGCQEATGGSNGLTKQAFLLPGEHGDCVEVAEGKEAVRNIVEALARQFLQLPSCNSVPMRRGQPVTGYQMLEWYAALKLRDRQRGLATSKRVHTWKSYGKSFNPFSRSGHASWRHGRQNLPGKVTVGSEALPTNQSIKDETCETARSMVFVNAHHERQFRLLFPQIWNLLFPNPYRKDKACSNWNGYAARALFDRCRTTHNLINEIHSA